MRGSKCDGAAGDGGLWLVAIAIGCLSVSTAQAQDLRVFSSGAPAAVERSIIARMPQAYESTTLTVTNLQRIEDKIAAGEEADVVVLPRPAIDALARKGVVDPQTRVDLAKVGVGVIVNAQASTPVVASIDDVKRLLLSAKAIVYPDPQGGGFTGAHVERVIGAMGVSDAVLPKVTHLFAIHGGVEAVATGTADVGVFNISEVVGDPRVKLAGALPDQIQNTILFSGAVTRNSKSPERAAALLDAFANGGGETWRRAGFFPIAPLDADATATPPCRTAGGCAENP